MTDPNDKGAARGDQHMRTWTFLSAHEAERADGVRLSATSHGYLVSHGRRSWTADEMVALCCLIESAPAEEDVRRSHVEALAQMPAGARLGMTWAWSGSEVRPPLEKAAARVDQALPELLAP